MKKIIKLLSLFLILILLTACNQKKEIEIDLNDTKEIQFHDLSLTIPKVYEKNKDTTDHFEFYSIPEEKNNFYCTFELLENKYYKEKLEEEIENELPKDYFESYKVFKVVINSHEWYFAEAKSKSKGGLYYLQGVYTTTYNNVGYTFEYTSYSPDKASCKELFENITDSLRFE